MKLAKSDKKIKLVVEIVGIVVILIMICIFALVKGVNNDKTPSKTTEHLIVNSDNTVIDTSSNNTSNNGDIKSEDGVVIDNTNTNTTTKDTEKDTEDKEIENNVENKVDKEVGEVETEEDFFYSKLHDEQNTKLIESDQESYDIINNLMNSTKLNQYFSPSYEITKSVCDEGNGKEYRYTYNAVDTETQGKYSDLMITMTSGINKEAFQSLNISFAVMNDIREVSTVRAELATGLSNMYDIDAFILATEDGVVEFEKDGSKYNLTVSSGQRFIDNYTIIYCMINKLDNIQDNTYNNNKDSINKEFDLTNITKKKDITLDDKETTNEIKDIAGFEGVDIQGIESITVSNNNTTETKSIELKMENGGTLELKSTRDKLKETSVYSVTVVDESKTEDELKDTAVKIADELFNVVMTNVKYNETESETLSFTNSRVAVTITDNRLSVTTAKSDYDIEFANKKQRELEQESLEYELDPETMEYKPIFPDELFDDNGDIIKK